MEAETFCLQDLNFLEAVHCIAEKLQYELPRSFEELPRGHREFPRGADQGPQHVTVAARIGALLGWLLSEKGFGGFSPSPFLSCFWESEQENVSTEEGATKKCKELSLLF